MVQRHSTAARLTHVERRKKGLFCDEAVLLMNMPAISATLTRIPPSRHSGLPKNVLVHSSVSALQHLRSNTYHA